MSTNDTDVKNDDPITEAPAEVAVDVVADLAAAKAEAETKPEAQVSEPVAQSDPTPEAEAPADATLTKEPDHDLDWHKKAYAQSTAEALRLKKENDELKAGKVETPPPVVTPPVSDEVLTPEQLYIRQKQNEEITEAFSEISEKYPSLKDKDTYDKFVAQANILGRVITETDKRFPSPKELYEKTVVILGLTPDNSEAIGSALKDAAGAPRTSSAPASPAPATKVTEAMIAANLKMYPGKTRQEIIDELEPHIT